MSPVHLDLLNLYQPTATIVATFWLVLRQNILNFDIEINAIELVISINHITF